MIDGQAVNLDPNSSPAYLNRSVTRRVKGDFVGALDDLSRFRELVPQDPDADYTRLWTWLIRVRQNQKDAADRELSAALSNDWNASPQDWVSKNAQFLLGQIDETEYLAAAASPGDKTQDLGQHCEAWYYAGMKRLLANDKATAADDFRKSVATGKTDFYEYAWAQAELKAITPPK